MPAKLTVLPLHTVLLEALEPITGKGFTVIPLTAVFEQPVDASVPVTVYCAVAAGENARPLVTPLDQV